jgi:hypothetical protein
MRYFADDPIAAAKRNLQDTRSEGDAHLGATLGSLCDVKLHKHFARQGGLGMDILPCIKEVIEADPNDDQLDKFLEDLRESLATSNKQFLSLSILVITALVTYHLVSYEGASSFSLNSIEIANTVLFRRAFLLVPAALLGARACIGYLRRCQREVYDYLAISRYRVLGKTGLHELRLPSDYILGLFLLRTEGGTLGKIISSVVGSLSMTVFSFAPAIYVINESVKNITAFGSSDFLTVAASRIAIALSGCSLLVVWLALRIKAE